jgi:hypothetical protein
MHHFFRRDLIVLLVLCLTFGCGGSSSSSRLAEPGNGTSVAPDLKPVPPPGSNAVKLPGQNK